MTTPTLWFTHLAAFAAGGLVVYWTMKARTRRGATVTEQQRERSKAWVGLLVLAAILVVFGLQVRDANHRASEDRERRDAFTSQQACLNRYSIALGEYLTDTLNKRVQANNKLDRAAKALVKAQLRKDLANDRVVEVVAGGSIDNPPTATQDDFVQALEDFRAAKAHLVRATRTYDAVERETRDTLADTGTTSKPYDPPKVDCSP